MVARINNWLPSVLANLKQCCLWREWQLGKVRVWLWRFFSRIGQEIPPRPRIWAQWWRGWRSQPVRIWRDSSWTGDGGLWSCSIFLSSSTDFIWIWRWIHLAFMDHGLFQSSMWKLHSSCLSSSWNLDLCVYGHIKFVAQLMLSCICAGGCLAFPEHTFCARLHWHGWRRTCSSTGKASLHFPVCLWYIYYLKSQKLSLKWLSIMNLTPEIFHGLCFILPIVFPAVSIEEVNT